MADDEKSKNQILQALDALSHTLYQARATRRTTSLALPRSADGEADDAVVGADAVPVVARPRSRRLSLTSPFRSRSSKLDRHEKDDDDDEDDAAAQLKRQTFTAVTPEEAAADEEKNTKGIWGWRPIRALSHMGMHRVGCLFSVEVVAERGLPPSMNGLRLAVSVRRKEARGRDGALQTMPARVHNTAADFDETLYVRCHLYCGGKPLRFEPRPFLVSAVAVDAPELELGQSAVDLSALGRELADACAQQQGECPRRQWDMAFPLAGKAKGGELVVRIAFQVLDDGGLGIVGGQPDGADNNKTTAADSSSSTSSTFARKISKSSFSIMSPKVLRSKLSSLSPKMGVSTTLEELKDIDGFKLDEHTPPAGAEVKDKVHKETGGKTEKVKVVEQQKEAERVLEAKVEEQKQPEEEMKEEEQKQPEEEAKEEEQKQLEEEEAKEEQEKQTEEAKEEQEKQPEEVKEEQLKQPAEVNKEQLKQPEEAKEEQQKEPEPEQEEVKSDESELPEFDVVDKTTRASRGKKKLKRMNCKKKRLKPRRPSRRRCPAPCPTRPPSRRSRRRTRRQWRMPPLRRKKWPESPCSCRRKEKTRLRTPSRRGLCLGGELLP